MHDGRPANTPIVLAQIGCGYWGPNLLRNFSAQADSRVKWVAELDVERQEYVRRTFPHSGVTSSWEEAILDPEVDAVVVATPPDTHYTLARAALAAGKHVLVEKPLATSTSDADDLVRLARAGRQVLMAGHTFLYNMAVRHMKDLITSGQIGDVLYVYSQRLNLGQARSDVNAWWSLAPHDLSILLYLLGDLPETVAVRGVTCVQPGIEDVAFAVLTWSHGVVAHVHVSWLDPGKVRRMTVVGSRKMVVYDDVSEDKIAILDKGVDRVPKLGERMDFDLVGGWQLRHRTGDVLLPRIADIEPLKTEAAHFLDCIRNGTPSMTGAPHARDVVAVLEAGHESLRRGGEAVRLDIASPFGVRAPS
jgi:predicted dehydrogenase